VPADELAVRARAIAAGTGSEAVATEALPGAGSAPGATIPSWGVTLVGDHLAALRAHDPPVIARAAAGTTVLDVRAVEPADDVVLVAALDGLARGETGG
jgi:L-seryl-tRNA(Ser) seleniumtransferase